MWTAKLAYLADVFSNLNDLNCSLQDNHSNIFTLRNKTDAFKKKDDIDVFPCLQDIVANASVDTGELFTLISQHLQELTISFGQYFPDNADPRKGNFWIISSPFAEDIDSCNLNTVEKKSLMELSCDTTLMSKYKAKSFPSLSLIKNKPRNCAEINAPFVFQKLRYNRLYHFCYQKDSSKFLIELFTLVCN